MPVTNLATEIGSYSILLMWAALIIRARPAWTGHYQRGLWLAILTAAIATTLFQPHVIDFTVDVTGNEGAVTLSRNLVGVLSAGLTLYFIIDSTRDRRLRIIIAVSVTPVLATLHTMHLAHGNYPGPDIPPAGGPATPTPAYWLIVCCAHLLTDIVAIIVCEQYARRASDRDLVRCLRLFALGSLLAIAYWGAILVHLYSRMPGALPWMAVIINVHGASRALTLLVPTAFAAARLVRDIRTVWVLWPLWRDLFTAVPSVALADPQPSRLQQILRPRAPIALQAHRQVIETYDAILHLRTYVQPEVYEQALHHAQGIKTAARHTEAAALACVLGQARRAKLAGEPATHPHPLPSLDQGDAALLLAIARMWSTMSAPLPGQEPLTMTAA